MIPTQAIRAGLALMIATVAAGATTGLGLAGQPVPQPSARPPLFTEAQAGRGEALFRQSCAGCHGATLTGGTAPALTGPTFEASWAIRASRSATSSSSRGRPCRRGRPHR
jgi:mono/diheme cytochrome c family protein